MGGNLLGETVDSTALDEPGTKRNGHDLPAGQMTADQFERVFFTKVGGLDALLRATSDHPVLVIALFSSVAARGGNAMAM